MADYSLLRVIVIVFSVLFFIAAIVVNALAGTGKGELYVSISSCKRLSILVDCDSFSCISKNRFYNLPTSNDSCLWNISKFQELTVSSCLLWLHNDVDGRMSPPPGKLTSRNETE